LLRPEGRLVFINSMKGSTSAVSVRDIMQKRLTVTGSTLRSRDAAFKAELTRAVEENVWPVIERKAFKAVVYKTFPLAEAGKAHALMESSTHIGKIVLVVAP
jgi:NADPH:quinone reductase-like Zn-dependent oxidoreductase